VNVLTRLEPSTKSQYPLAEGFLDQANIQPYIHDCLVTVSTPSRTIKFRIFFKNHCRLTANACWPPRAQTLRGDVLIMRVGVRAMLVNFRPGDASISDRIIERYDFHYYYTYH
jgi:hypothetical protein